MKSILKTISTSAKAIITVIVLSFFTSTSLQATHLVGGEITYEWQSGNVYSVTLTLYRDCAGITSPGSATINFSSASCSQSGAATLALIGQGTMISPICTDSLALASCNGGSLYSIEKYVYTGVVTLPGTCDDWIFSWSECCRNGAITNLMTASSHGMYLSTMVNNLDVPFNNSVQFGIDPVNIIYNNTTTNLNWYAFDVDGDSILYELTSARESSTSNVPYATGYTFQQPFLSSSATTLNGSGIITVTPNALQVNAVAMRISEYRNGVLIGEVNRDFQIAVINSSNQLPTLSGMNGTNTFVTNGCPGDTILFDVTSGDPDAGQTVSLEISPSNPNIGFNSTGTPFPTGTFSWVPGPADVSSQPYTFIITAQDDYCNYYGSESNLYYVYVNGCNTNDVWPGDANSDGNADLYDLLAIGLAYNDNGPVRPSANLTWTQQPCPDWTNSFMSGINHKHADTDGNGTVNLDDTTAIMQNYGLNHPLRLSGPSSLQNVTDLTITANYDTVGLMTSVIFDIELTAPVDSIYGLAFRLFFDPALVDITTAQVTYPGSMFGTNGVDMVKIDYTNTTTGFVDIALSRIDQMNISGMGPVARVTIVTTDNVSGKVTLNVEATDIVSLTSNEQPVTVNSMGDAVVIDPMFVGVNEVTAEMIQIHPIPANEVLNVNFSGNEEIDYISIYDVTGKMVEKLYQPGNNVKINVSTLPKGVYTLRTSINNNIINKKFVIL